MRSRWMKKIVKATLFVMLLASGSMLKLQAQDSEKISKLFTEIRHHAVLAERDADLLQTYSRSTSMAWQSHARRVGAMREHVNDLLKDFKEAQDLRQEGSPWQQEAIDQLEPLLKGMAEHLTATIEHMNENRANLKMSRWKEYAATNRDYSFKAANLIRDLVDYGEAKAKAELLEKKLEIAEAS